MMMKTLAQRIVSFALIGVSAGCSFLILFMEVRNLAGGSAAVAPFTAEFGWQTLGACACGLAFVMPALLYALPRPRPAVKTLIHFGCGAAVSIPVAIRLGWMPNRPGAVFLFLAVEAAVLSANWIIYAVNQARAEKINRRIGELQRFSEEEKAGGDG